MVLVGSPSGEGDWEPRVGQIQSLFGWLPYCPGSEELQIADIQWFGQEGRNVDLLDSLQVNREFVNDTTGNYIRVQEVSPTHVALVPHLQNRSWWQVLHRPR